MSVKAKNIRNVVVLGHSKSGKTSLIETMLFESGAIDRRGSIEEGNTVSDYTNIEKERGNSIFSTLTHANWKDSKINIIDTPGFDDFVGEVVSSLKVADTALVVLNSTQGVEVGTELIWEHVDQNLTPTIFVINQMDHEKSNYDLTLSQAKERFGSKVIPVQYPLNQGNEFNTIVDALRMIMYVFDKDGGKPKKVAIPESELEKAEAMHNALVEAAAENEEGLMEKYFEEGTLNEDDLADGLRIALAKHEIYPVFVVSAIKNEGSGRIMGFINDIAPSPVDRPASLLEDGSSISLDSSDLTSLFIYKTISEPKIGMVSYFKVYSGEIKVGDELVNANNRNSERISQLYIAEGKNRINVQSLVAGDIGVTVKLKNSHTNQTLNQKGTNIQIKKIDFPESRIRVAMIPPSKNEIEKVFKALHQIEEEDPTLHVEQSIPLKQTILHGQGQLHLDLIKYRIEKVYGLHLAFEKPRIAFRETITKMSEGYYRHKKQSGGSGQFAEVHMRIEPYTQDMSDPYGLTVRSKEIIDLQGGGTLAFYWCIVGGSIDSKYINAIKKGIMQQMEEGPLTGSYCQNIRVSVYDGKMHAVDSNDMAFMLASSHVFQNCFNNAKSQLLEPIYDVEVLVPDAAIGEVMGDLQTRRAIVNGVDSDGHYQKIMAKVPLMEMYQYSTSLRSLSHGRARFTRKFASYNPVPMDIQQKLTLAYQEQ